MNGDELPMLVIYDRPSDHPRGYVIRRWLIQRGNPEPVASELLAKDLPTLDAARAFVPPGMTCIPRLQQDDPRIVEVWF